MWEKLPCISEAGGGANFKNWYICQRHTNNPPKCKPGPLVDQAGKKLGTPSSE